jgi:hypothetical protein
MARVTQIDPIDQVAGRVDETPEPAETVSSNPDNIDHGEMIWLDNGTQEWVRAVTDRGIGSLREIPAGIRTRNGAIREFLRGEPCDADVIERIMADARNR